MVENELALVHLAQGNTERLFFHSGGHQRTDVLVNDAVTQV